MAYEVGDCIKIKNITPKTNPFLNIGDIGVITRIDPGYEYYIRIKDKNCKDTEDNENKEIRGCFKLSSYKYFEKYYFKKGDRIKIVSKTSKYKNQYGTIVRDYGCYDDYVYILVDGDIGVNKVFNTSYTCKLAESSIELILDENQENEIMKKLVGFKKVAVIEMSGTNYYYALYDEDINVGDTVLVSGAANGKLLIIKDIVTTKESEEVFNKNITAEVMCKVDLSAYNTRVKNREEAEKIRKEMDKKIAEMDEMNKYVMYAERSPELMEMLTKYRELI